MRELLYNRLVANSELQELITGDAQDSERVRIYQWGSLGSGDIPEVPKFPFCTIYESPSSVNQEVQETARSQNRFFQVFCYDEWGTGYLLIERILRIVRDTVLELPMQVSPSGVRCTDARWLGMSGDGHDPEYKANMKSVTIKFTASQ